MEGEEFTKIVQETIDSEPLNNLDLKLVGFGCEKIVFETPGSQRKVIKVNIDEIIFRIAEKFGLTTKEKSGNGQLQDLIAEHKIIEADLISVFGSEHVLRNGVFRGKIPFAKDILFKLTKDIPVIQRKVSELPDGTVFEIEALIETQIMANELKDREKFKTKIFSIDLVTEDSFRGMKNVTSAMALIRKFVNKNFLAEFQIDSSDQEYVKVVREILVKIIQFTKKTGLMVDIFGPDNLTIFTNGDGNFDYHLLDVILPGPAGLWNKKIEEDPEFNLLRHYYQFYYAVSSLGDKLGVEDNLKPEDLIYFRDNGIPTGGRFNRQ